MTCVSLALAMWQMSVSDAIGWLTQIAGVDSPAATRMRALVA
jgi:hypothetical protein